MSVSESFTRIESWLSDNAPNILLHLNKPISNPVTFDRVESILGAKLPPSVREAYTFHDGETVESKGLFGGWRWLPLQEILHWNDRQKRHLTKHPFTDFKPSFMIPLLVSTATMRDLRYVETSDESGQEETPVIEWNHLQPTRDVKYGSFANYLSTFAERLERSEYVADSNDQQKVHGLILKS